LRYEERRFELENSGNRSISEEEMYEVLLADLQQRQGVDFEGILQDIQKMVCC
jgi:hypothetical protein